jgi:hypothetical protein
LYSGSVTVWFTLSTTIALSSWSGMPSGTVAGAAVEAVTQTTANTAATVAARCDLIMTGAWSLIRTRTTRSRYIRLFTKAATMSQGRQDEARTARLLRRVTAAAPAELQRRGSRVKGSFIGT